MARRDDGPAAGLIARFYGLVTGDEEARLCRDIPEAACREQPENFLLISLALSLSKTGDGLANPKVVLPWLLGAVGAPAYVSGLLVPIRESLALVPQLAVGAVIRQFAVRKWFWSLASAMEGLAILTMAAGATLGLTGAAGGWLVLAMLTLFALARGVASVASKDTLGKTVSKTRRGRINGLAEMVAGIVAMLAGAYFVLVPDAQRSQPMLFGLIAAAGLAWLLAALVFGRVREVPGAIEGGVTFTSVMGEQLTLLVHDRPLQIFLLTRSLLLGTALAAPVVVSLAQARTAGTAAGLGSLIIASALATAVSAFAWGRLADRSSRLTMAAGAGLAGVIGVLVAGCVWTDLPMSRDSWFYVVAVFGLGLGHAAVRVGRKTQLVDMAGGERRAAYVALSNTVIGLILLAAGAASAALMTVSLPLTLLALSLAALAGCGFSLALPDVQR